MKKKSKEISRRDFLYKGSAAAISVPLLAKTGMANPVGVSFQPAVEQEWKNKQSGMHYRQLGRTGMMVSEIVNGGNGITPENLRPTEKAVELGLNYLDSAPAYGRGESEKGIGKLLSGPVNRDRVFLTTKISPFSSFRNSLYKEIFDGLPSGKQESLLKKAAEMRKETGVDRPVYFISYWPGHSKQLDDVYLSNAMMDEYGERVDGSPVLEQKIIESLESSLERVGTDHFDIMMCPHGCSTPEEVNNPFIKRTFKKLKKQGKVRFLGLSTHNDMARVLKAASDTGYYDMVMMSYNLANYGFTDHVINEAVGRGMGIIAMKAARIVATEYDEFRPLEAWRAALINQVIPGDMKVHLKAYLWALQNPNLSAVISDIDKEEWVEEILALAGQKVELHPA